MHGSKSSGSLPPQQREGLSSQVGPSEAVSGAPVGPDADDPSGASERSEESAASAADSLNLSIVESCNTGVVVGSEALMVKARRCGCGVCPVCASLNAWKESRKVQEVIRQWKFPQMWTLTVNPKAYPDPRAILEWIKEKRCVSTWIQALDRKGFLSSRDWYCAMEFQDGSRRVDGNGTGYPHFHLLLNTTGYVPHPVAWEAWERRAPQWRVGGQMRSKHDPCLGFVSFDKVYNAEGMGNYLCKYLSKGVKQLPAWFVEYLDDNHNMQLKYHSQGFFASLPKPQRKYQRKPRPSKPRKRKTVAERLEACKHDADVYMVIDGRSTYVDRAAFPWEKVVQMLEAKLSESDLREVERTGRLGISMDEFAKVGGMDALERLLRMTDGKGVGLAMFDDYQRALLGDRVVPTAQDGLYLVQKSPSKKQ